MHTHRIRATTLKIYKENYTKVHEVLLEYISELQQHQLEIVHYHASFKLIVLLKYHSSNGILSMNIIHPTKVLAKELLLHFHFIPETSHIILPPITGKYRYHQQI